MAQVEWRPSKTPGRTHGYLGSQVVVVLEPNDGPYADSFKLDVLLPGCGGERLVQYTDTESAKEYFEKVVLPGWLTKTGLQSKQQRKAAKVPPVKEAKQFTDKDGNVLSVGDTVRAKKTSFDGPIGLFGLDLTVEKFGRTKVYVSCPREYRDKMWPVSPETVLRIEKES